MISWACYELTRNPAVVAKMRKEIDEICPDPDVDISHEMLSSLKYLDWVIKGPPYLPRVSLSRVKTQLNTKC